MTDARRRGDCINCPQSFRLKKDGTVRKHLLPILYFHQKYQPKEYCCDYSVS